MKEGFKIGDGTYAVIPWGKRYVIIHNGQQLDDVSTVNQAQKYIEQHKKMYPEPKAPSKPRATQNSQKIEKPSSGQQGSETPKPKVTRKAPTTPKSKSVPAKKPSTRRKKAP